MTTYRALALIIHFGKQPPKRFLEWFFESNSFGGFVLLLRRDLYLVISQNLLLQRLRTTVEKEEPYSKPLFVRFAPPALPWTVAALEMQLDQHHRGLGEQGRPKGDPMYGGGGGGDDGGEATGVSWGLEHPLYEYHRAWRRMFSTGRMGIVPRRSAAPCSLPSDTDTSRLVYFLLTSVPPRAWRLRQWASARGSSRGRCGWPCRRPSRA